MNGELKEIVKPHEILDMQDGETKVLDIKNYELGKMTIITAEVPDGKEIKALRVHVKPESKPLGVPYWDVTSQTLIAQLLPYLAEDDFNTKRYTITKRGVAPRARFTLEVSG